MSSTSQQGSGRCSLTAPSSSKEGPRPSPLSSNTSLSDAAADKNTQTDSENADLGALPSAEPSKLKHNSPRYEFRQIPNSPRFNHCEPMQQEDTDRIDVAAREALWLCNMLLDHPIRSDVFNSFFKNGMYQMPILNIFQLLRSWLNDFLNRNQDQDVDNKTSQEPKEIFCFIKSDGTNKAFRKAWQGYDAVAACDEHTMWLFESFWDGEYSHALADILDMDMSDSAMAQAVHYARSATLLHELVHVISCVHWEEFVESVDCKRINTYVEKLGFDRISDVYPKDFYNKNMFTDFEIMKTFTYKKNWWQWKKSCRMAASTDHVMMLAKLHDGSVASLLNAANYEAFAVATAFGSLREEKKRIEEWWDMQWAETELVPLN